MSYGAVDIIKSLVAKDENVFINFYFPDLFENSEINRQSSGYIKII